MSTPYTLYYAPDNASLIIRIALEMLGVPYQTRLVDRAKSAQRDEAYLMRNPLGLIPTLETEDGPLFETGAILLWLADRHGELFPAPTDEKRGDALKWLFFVSNSLHAGLRQMFYPEKFIAQDHASALRDGLTKRIRADFLQLDRIAADPSAPYLNGEEWSLLDIYVCA